MHTRICMYVDYNYFNSFLTLVFFFLGGIDLPYIPIWFAPRERARALGGTFLSCVACVRACVACVLPPACSSPSAGHHDLPLPLYLRLHLSARLVSQLFTPRVLPSVLPSVLHSVLVSVRHLEPTVSSTCWRETRTHVAPVKQWCLFPFLFINLPVAFVTNRVLNRMQRG